MRHKHLNRVIRRCRQLITDVEWWNANRTDAEPMDCEAERVLLRLAERAKNETDPKVCLELSAEMVRVATASVEERDGRGVLKESPDE
jgi:hypothetical protein